MSRFSLLNPGNNGIATPTLDNGTFSVPNGPTIAEGLTAGAEAVGRGLVARGADQEQADRRAEYEMRRQAEIDKQTHAAESERWLTNFRTRGITAHSAALDATRGIDSIDQANALVDQNFAGLQGEIDNIEDPTVKAKAGEIYAQFYTSAHDQAASLAFGAGIEQFAADKAAQLKSLSSSVFKGNLAPEQAQAQWAQEMAGQEKNFGHVRSREMLIQGNEQIGIAAYDGMVNENAPAALNYLKSDYAQTNIATERLASMTQHAKGLMEQQRQEASIQTEQHWTDEANSMFVGKAIAPTTDETKDFFDVASNEISAVSGGKVSTDDARRKLILPLLQMEATAPEPNQESFNRLADQMPQDGEAQKQLNVISAQLAKRMQTVDTAKTEAAAISQIWNSQEKIPAGKTFSDAGLNAFHQLANNPAQEAKFFNGTGMWPTALQGDLVRLSGEPTEANLTTLANVGQNLDNNRALLLSRELKNPELVETLFQTTRDQPQQERARVVKVLSDEKSVRAMPEANRQFTGNKTLGIEALKLPVGMTSDQTEQYRAQFMLNFADRSVTYREPISTGEQAVNATKNAQAMTDSWFASEYPKITVGNWIAGHKTFAVPKAVMGAFPTAKFADAMESFNRHANPQWTWSSPPADINPSASFMAAGKAIIPSVGSQGVHEFMVFDGSASTYVGRNDPQFASLEAQFKHLAPPGSGSPDYAWKESFGRVSVQEFDSHFDNLNDTYGAKIIALAKRNVPQVGVDPKQYEQLLMQECNRLSREAGWPSFLSTLTNDNAAK